MIEIRHKRTGELLQVVRADTLEGADLQDARLTSANLRGASLRRADLRGARLSYADLAGADLSGADIREASLGGANLTAANLSAADLTWAGLRRARLIGANLRNTTLRADLCGADLSGAEMAGANLTGTDYDQRTRWPTDFDPEAAGARRWADTSVRDTDLAEVYAAVMGTARRWLITRGGLARGALETDRWPHLLIAPPMGDALDWGPQHVDLPTQAEMRQRFFRDPFPLRELAQLDDYAKALQSGDEVLFWCDPTLPDCLAILWALDGLQHRGADLRRASLILSPVRALSYEPLRSERARRAFENRVPVAELVAPLVAIRRHLASDSTEIQVDLSPLPPAVQEWATVLSLLADYLPDARGLSLIDSRLLGSVTDEWQSPIPILADTFMHAPRGHYWGDLWVYEQFLDLGGHPMFVSRPGPRREDALVEFRFKGGRATRFAHVRLTERGRQVRDGTADALHSRHYSRWAGGRHITHERPLRRPDLRRYSE